MGRERRMVLRRGKGVGEDRIGEKGDERNVVVRVRMGYESTKIWDLCNMVLV
jgi:hypothetical protein